MSNVQTSSIVDPEDFYTCIRNEILAESYLAYSPGQRMHLGKILLKAMRRHEPDTVIQMDASNNEQETVGSVLDRSIDTAKALRSCGLQVGDVVAVMGRNHLDASIPFYASFFVGAAFMGIDNDLKLDELKSILSIGKPKLLFCEVEHLENVQKIKEELHFEVVTFGKSEDFVLFSEFIHKHKTDEPNYAFRVSEYDPEKTSALLAATSGSSGLPKLADITHANLAPLLPQIWTSGQGDYRLQSRLALSLAPLHWLPASVLLLQSAVFCISRVQTSAPLSSGHIAEIVKNYKPSWMAATPSVAANLLKAREAAAVDWGCVETFGIWGGPVSDELVSNINKWIGKNAVVNGYGMTEASGLVFSSSYGKNSLGTAMAHVEVKLIDPDNGTEIIATGVGELLLKGPSIFKGYYNDPESTESAFSGDGWFHSGDLLRRDDGGQFYFVDRLGTNFKYRDNHVSPLELERLLRRLAGVAEAAVVGVPQGALGAVPLACVVAAPPHNLTVAHVMDYVKENLSDSKQLRGGVMFVQSLPLTAGGKVDRKQLLTLAVEHYANAQMESGVEGTNGVERIRLTDDTAPKRSLFCCC